MSVGKEQTIQPSARERISVRVGREFHKRFKLFAVAQDSGMQDLAEAWLAEGLERAEARTRREAK